MHACTKNLLIAGLMLASATGTFGQNVQREFIVPEDTLSPDGRYGVQVPYPYVLEPDDKSPEPKNRLVDTKDGRVLATIQTEFTGYVRMNNSEVLPSRWSADGSLLLWEVDGKWTREALVLLKLHTGHVEWQLDVMKVVQKALLLRTQHAAPRQYAKWKKANAEIADGANGYRTVYPEGFSIEVEVPGGIAFPLQVRAELTAEAKPGEGYREFQSHLEGTVDPAGKFKVESFHLGPSNPSHF